MAGNRPDLFIIGAPKSGTSSLYAYLREHPDIHMSPVKEPMYFSPDVYRSAVDNKFVFDEDEGRYLALFDGATGERRIGEASTHYLCSPMAPRLIKAFAPDARLVCLLRDPVEMVYAWHGHRVFRGVEERPDFRALLSDEARRDEVLRVGRYGEQLGRWLDVFGRERLHVIVFDDFVADTPRAFRQLLDFLEVDPDFQPSSFAVHNASASKSRLVPYLRTRPGRLAARLVTAVAGQERARGISKALRRASLFRRGKSRESLPPAIRDELRREYLGEVRQAGTILQRDLVGLWWGR